MIFQLFSHPVEFLAFLAAIALAVAVHEAAHAFIASRLGDNTARLAGRLTLNPLAHIDPLGAIAFLLVGFGWGKPVPVNPNNFRQPAFDDLKVALAGPASNLIMAAAFGLPVRFLASQLQDWALGVLTLMTVINLALMVFNLIPVPPLDGSKIIGVFFGQEILYKMERYSIFLLLAIVLLARGGFPLVNQALGGSVETLFRLITGASSGF